MATYTCTKCGGEVSSKCIGQRGEFPTGKLEKLMWAKSMMTAELVPDKSRNFREGYGFNEKLEPVAADEKGFGIDLQVRLTVYEKAPTAAQSLHQLKKMLNDPNFDIDLFCCKHEWVLQDAECDLGCCKRKD